MTSLLTSSSHPFLGLPVGLLPPKLPSTIRFWILLSNVLTLRSAHFSIFTCMYVARSLSLYTLRCFMSSIAINLYQYKLFPKDLFLLRTDRVCGTLMNGGEHYEDPSRCLLQFECSVLTYLSAVHNSFVT